MASLDAQFMLPSLKIKWALMPADARETLKFAFKDAMRNAALVADHKLRRCGHNNGNVNVHEIRIGYAIFVIAVFKDMPSVILDMYLTDNNYKKADIYA